jgi:hypothetical protein
MPALCALGRQEGTCNFRGPILSYL